MELIKQYGDIDSLLKNAKNIKQEKRRKVILESENDIRTSLELVRLKNNIDLPINIEEIISYAEIKEQNQKLFHFLNEQGFKSIADRLKNNSYIVKSATIDNKID